MFTILLKELDTCNVESQLLISYSHVNTNKQKQSSEDRTSIRKIHLMGIRIGAAAVLVVDDVPHLTFVTLNDPVVSIKRQLVAKNQPPKHHCLIPGYLPKYEGRQIYLINATDLWLDDIRLTQKVDLLERRYLQGACPCIPQPQFHDM